GPVRYRLSVAGARAPPEGEMPAPGAPPGGGGGAAGRQQAGPPGAARGPGVAAASPPNDSSLPPRSRPVARATSEAEHNTVAVALEAACTSPTRCCSRCSSDQSAQPEAAAG